MTYFRTAVRIVIILVLALICLAALALGSAHRWFGPAVRASVVERLEKRFKSKVELDALQISFFPFLKITASNVRFHHHGRTDVPPLISMKKMDAHIDPWDLMRKPVRVRFVRLEGMQILIPPRTGKRDDRSERASKAVLTKADLKERYPFFVEKVDIAPAVLTILPRKPDGEPLVWDIDRLRLRSVGMDRPMNFDAKLTNAKPPGLINSTGQFGPWQADDPGQTFVAGTYTFKDADLSVFSGIAGRLFSEGDYRGILERIEVHGSTDTPDFRVAVSGNRVHLRTQFDALVDGTSGDTMLEPVKARIGNTWLTARGGAMKLPGTKGKTIKLHVTVSDGHVEDLLRLAVKSNTPFLVGGIRFETEFLLPPADQEISERLNLDGRFSIRSGRFTSPGIREKLAEFSWRARGRPESEEGNPDRVASDLGGRFVLKKGIMTFSSLSFGIPGALVSMNGTYALRSEQIDFEGTLRMQAKLSETVSGVKSVLLKVVDPIFAKKGAGTVLPIKVTGTQDKPQFGVDFKRIGKK